ncbi:Crp/Fnr family transcriptional regulator [Desulfovibrio aminophilus]|nr:Crp/Fnr family transcriptional regulator [Desulfovibrio aminophilus]MCM0754656.1 Crp/Fnr family transcriptional regulator [Desulfovibrio aminophilus]
MSDATRPRGPRPSGEPEGREFARIPLDNAPWRDVLHLATPLDFAKDEAVIPENAPPDFLYFLERGEVRMLRAEPGGQEKTLWYVDPDHLFGETPLLCGGASRNRHICTRPSRIHAFRRETVREEIFPVRPDLMFNLMETLACKVRILSNQVADMSLDELSARVCRYLHLHAERLGDQGGATLLNPRLNQQELAQLLGVHRVTLNKTLRDLEHEGVLGGYRRDEVRVLDPARFLTLALS